MYQAGDLRMLSPRTKKALYQNTSPGESILFCLTGNYEQALVALEDRLLIVKPGPTAGATFGAKTMSVNYCDITGIELQTGFLSAYLEVTSPGFESSTKERKSDVRKLPNCLPFNKADLRVFQPYLDQLREKITAAKRGNAPPNAQILQSGGGEGLAAEITKLASLRDSGVLTEEEFQLAKKKLLAS